MTRLMTIEDVKARLPGVSERAVRELANRHGCFIQRGRSKFYDFKKILEAGVTEAVAQQAKVPVAQFAQPGVYFISGGIYTKIGHSSNVSARMLTLSLASPVPLVLHAIIPGGAVQEKRFHRLFKPYRRHGEWFELPHDWRETIDLANRGIQP